MACIYVPLTKVIVAWFRKKDFAKLNGGVIATGNFAGIMAAYPTTILLNSIIWRDMFFIIGVITIILTFLCILFVHNRPKDIGMREIRELYPEDEQMHETYGKVPLRNGVATVLRSGRAFWMPASTYFFVFGTMMLFQGRWAAKYFDTTYEFIIAGTFLVTMLAVGKMISTAISGTVASKIGSKRITVLAANFGYLGVWGVLWIFAGKIDMLWFWVGMNFMFGFFSGFVSLSFAQVKEWFPASISGTAIALVNTMVFLGGGVLQTLSIWIINERSPAFGEFTVMWGIAFLCVAAACVLSYMSKDNNTGSVRPIRDSGGT
jgi:sugar phosphate permease